MMLNDGFSSPDEIVERLRAKKEEELEEVKRRAAEEAQRARLQREEESGAKSKEQEQEQEPQIKEQEAVEAESKADTTLEETNVDVGTGGDASCLHFPKVIFSKQELRLKASLVVIVTGIKGYLLLEKKCSSFICLRSTHLGHTCCLMRSQRVFISQGCPPAERA